MLFVVRTFWWRPRLTLSTLRRPLPHPPCQRDEKTASSTWTYSSDQSHPGGARHTLTGSKRTSPHLGLKRHGPFVAFHFYCEIMLYSINYTYYSIKTVKICFHVPFRVENKRSKGCLTLFTRRPRGVFETVVGVAKSPEGNARSRNLQLFV